MDLNWLFDNFGSVAFRLEVLPFFASDTRKPGYAVFAETGALPADHNAGWRQEVSDGTRAGRSYRRLRLISEPPSDYERYEIASYALSLIAGEDIRLVPRSAHPGGRDFWLFDDRWIAYMNYDESGELVDVDAHQASAAEKEMAAAWMRVFREARTGLRTNA